MAEQPPKVDEQEDRLDHREENSGATPPGSTEAMQVLEALVFASEDPIPAVRLKELLPGRPDGRRIRSMVRALNEKLSHERHPFEVLEIGGGYQFRTVSYFQPWVQQLFKEKSARLLSIQALECLAIVAYQQPVTKAEIEAVRGVASDGAMKTLLEKHLVTIAGRSEKAGRPLLYGTTNTFLETFGLRDLSELPPLEEQTKNKGGGEEKGS